LVEKSNEVIFNDVDCAGSYKQASSVMIDKLLYSSNVRWTKKFFRLLA